MPIRISSLTRKITANGRELHRATAGRTGGEPSAAESALIEERRLLKKERDERKAQALLPGRSALDKLVRTHHPQAKAKAAKKDTHDAEVKKPKAVKSRAEKHAQKAAALDAARRTPKKPEK